MRRLLTTTTALLALAAPMMAAAPALAAPVQVTIKPAALPRGPNEAGPHLDGKTIHDGTIKVTVNAGRVLLYGKWNQSYIVATGNKLWGNTKLVRVAKTGNTKVLVAGIDPFNAKLDAVAGQVAYSYGDTTQKPTIGIYDLVQKQEIISRSFASTPRLLDFDLGRVIASFWTFTIKTVTWDTVIDTVAKVNSKRSNYASIAHGLIGYYDKDPQAGGCQVLAHLVTQSDRLWTSCKERIEAGSPDGRRFATIPLLTDGLGAADIVVRKAGGVAVAHYRINGYFGRIWWETNTKLLMQANGTAKAAVVRCKVADCNRATALSPTPDL
jgi:hypothetical protein